MGVRGCVREGGARERVPLRRPWAGAFAGAGGETGGGWGDWDTMGEKPRPGARQGASVSSNLLALTLHISEAVAGAAREVRLPHRVGRLMFHGIRMLNCVKKLLSQVAVWSFSGGSVFALLSHVFFYACSYTLWSCGWYHTIGLLVKAGLFAYV